MDKKQIIYSALIGLGVGLVITLLYFTFNPNVKIVDRPVIEIREVVKEVPKIKLVEVPMDRTVTITETKEIIDSTMIRRLSHEIDSLTSLLIVNHGDITLSKDTIVNEADTVRLSVSCVYNRIDTLIVNRQPIKTKIQIEHVPVEKEIPFLERKELWGSIGVIMGWLLRGLIGG